MMYLISEDGSSVSFCLLNYTNNKRKYEFVGGIKLTLFSQTIVIRHHALAHKIGFRFFCVSGWGLMVREQTQQTWSKYTYAVGCFFLQCPLILPCGEESTRDFDASKDHDFPTLSPAPPPESSCQGLNWMRVLTLGSRLLPSNVHQALLGEEPGLELELMSHLLPPRASVRAAAFVFTYWASD